MCIIAEFLREGDGSVPPQESQSQKKDVLYRLTSGVLGKGAKKPKPKVRYVSQLERFGVEGAGADMASFTPVEGLDTDTCDVDVVVVLPSGNNSPDLYTKTHNRLNFFRT